MDQSSPTRVLRIGPLLPALRDALAASYDVVAARTADDLPPDARTAEVLVVAGSVKVDEALLARLPALRLVANFGVGLDHVDLDAARARDVAVSHTPDALTDAVADTAVGLVIDVLRGFSAADRYVRAGRWEEGAFPLTREVSGRAVGILGLGRIGRAVAHRLEAFGCPISYHNRHEVPDVPYAYAASVLDLARAVDVLVAAVPGRPGQPPVVDAEVLEALGPRGCLVNVGRGDAVDQDALVRALSEGRLGGAGLDVFADEPHVPEELRALDSVVLLPHVASGTVETRQAMADLVLANIRTFVADGTLVTPAP